MHSIFCQYRIMHCDPHCRLLQSNHRVSSKCPSTDCNVCSFHPPRRSFHAPQTTASQRWRQKKLLPKKGREKRKRTPQKTWHIWPFWKFHFHRVVCFRQSHFQTRKPRPTIKTSVKLLLEWNVPFSQLFSTLCSEKRQFPGFNLYPQNVFRHNRELRYELWFSIKCSNSFSEEQIFPAIWSIEVYWLLKAAFFPRNVHELRG